MLSPSFKSVSVKIPVSNDITVNGVLHKIYQVKHRNMIESKCECGKECEIYIYYVSCEKGFYEYGFKF